MGASLVDLKNAMVADKFRCSILLLIFASGLLVSCGGRRRPPQRGPGAKPLELIRGETVEGTMEKFVLVSNCDTPINKSYSCSAGTSSTFTVGVSASSGISFLMTSDLEYDFGAELGFGQDTGEEINEFPLPADGQFSTILVETTTLIERGQIIDKRSDELYPFEYSSACFLDMGCQRTYPCGALEEVQEIYHREDYDCEVDISLLLHDDDEFDTPSEVAALHDDIITLLTPIVEDESSSVYEPEGADDVLGLFATPIIEAVLVKGEEGHQFVEVLVKDEQSGEIETVQITDQYGTYTCPTYLPSVHAVAVSVSFAQEQPDIYLFSLLDDEVVNLTQSPNVAEICPQYNTELQMIVYSAYLTDTINQIEVINFRDKPYRPVAVVMNGELNMQPTWQGQRIIFRFDQKDWSVDPYYPNDIRKEK